MKKIKLLVYILLLPVLAGCSAKNEEVNINFSIDENGIFPFYTVDKSGILWKVNNDGATCLNDKTDYLYVGKNRYFTKVISEDTIIYAASMHTENGKTLCTVKEQTADGQPTVIFENAVFDSLKINSEGNILFTDCEDNLYFRRKGTVSTVAQKVAQAEFTDDNQLVYRLNEISAQGDYPIYLFDGDNLTYLTDGEEIKCCGDGNVYILSDIHNIQKRTGTIQVATCVQLVSCETKFEVENVVLSQFENDFCGKYLLCADEKQTLMRYKVMYLSNNDENQARISEITSNVIAGKSLDENTFFCEINENGENYSVVIRDGKAEKLSAAYSTNHTYLMGGKIISLSDNKIFNGENGKIISETDNINTFFCGKDYYVYSQEKIAPYNLYISFENSDDIIFLSEVASLNIKIYGDTVFFLTGENGQFDLNAYDKNKKSVTAITSNVDESVGCIMGDDLAAVVKAESGILQLTGKLKTVDCGITVSRFVNQTRNFS